MSQTENGPLEPEQHQGTDLTDEQLSAVGLERMGSTGPDGAPLYEDAGRQEIDHVLSWSEAQAVARRRLGLPLLPQHMTREELLVELERVSRERDELHVERDEAREAAWRGSKMSQPLIETVNDLVAERDDALALAEIYRQRAKTEARYARALAAERDQAQQRLAEEIERGERTHDAMQQAVLELQAEVERLSGQQQVWVTDHVDLRRARDEARTTADRLGQALEAVRAYARTHPDRIETDDLLAVLDGTMCRACQGIGLVWPESVNDHPHPCDACAGSGRT